MDYSCSIILCSCKRRRSLLELIHNLKKQFQLSPLAPIRTHTTTTTTFLFFIIVPLPFLRYACEYTHRFKNILDSSSSNYPLFLFEISVHVI